MSTLVVMVSLLTLGLYVYVFRLAWPGPAQSISDPEEINKDTRAAATRWVAIVALIGHIFVARELLFDDQSMQLSIIYVANVVAVVMTLVVALVSLRLPIVRLFLLVIPVAFLTLFLGLFAKPGTATASVSNTPLLAHILISLVAYSTLMLAAFQSILLAVLERRLRTPGKQASQWLPPLETMEQLLVAMLWIGLALLTASIFSGFLFLEDMFAQHVSHHIVITSLSWLVYAFFLIGRYVFGWRGLTAVRWTLVAFTLLVIGYLGSKFVLEYILQR